MLYKHIVTALIGVGSVNIRYISTVLGLFRTGLEVIYKAAYPVKTHKLPDSASDNALKLRSVKHLRNNTVTAPLHSLSDNGLDIKRLSAIIDNYQQRRRLGLLHKPRYIYAGYSDRAYAFYVGIATRIARIGRVYIFKDICPKNISVGRNGRNDDIVIIGNRSIYIRLDLQLGAVRLETPVIRIWLEIRAVTDIRQLLADYICIDFKRRQRIPK